MKRLPMLVALILVFAVSFPGSASSGSELYDSAEPQTFAVAFPLPGAAANARAVASETGFTSFSGSVQNLIGVGGTTAISQSGARFQRGFEQLPAETQIEATIEIAGGDVAFDPVVAGLGRVEVWATLKLADRACDCVERVTTLVARAAPWLDTLAPSPPAYVEISSQRLRIQASLSRPDAIGPVDVTLELMGTAWCAGVCEARFYLDVLESTVVPV